ncbi:hypothetical protein BDV35DRAFT_388394 [Aspergillus flavus]|uniref:Uncharacterized protein n=1 Tax=Aspergillus flavus TaxID=5059 RepID=A0A5N6HDS7_ASPFL|nr:hypothetical protein BDV35DRAFT_388394 [Aspergillus flavus]
MRLRLEDIGGLIIAGLALATTTGHMIRAGKVRAEIAAKTKEKAQLESDLELVRRSRQAVEQVGLTDLATFKTVIRAIPAAATASSVDATEVKSWLENGAKEEDRPRYMDLNRRKGVRSYNSMASYLRTYGRAETSMQKKQ